MKNTKDKKEFISVICKLFVTVAVITALFVFVFGITIAKDNDMYPRISEGDLVLFYKITDTYHIGDVIVYETEGVKKTGRVVALGGDTIEFSADGRLMIDGCLQTIDSFYTTTEIGTSKINFPYEIPEGSVFILADYRTNAFNDSRMIGAVAENDIDGRIITTVRRRDF